MGKLNDEMKKIVKGEDRWLLDMFGELNYKEKEYRSLPKDKLIDRLILCEMELEENARDENEGGIELWYFVGDETGTKYLSNEEPKFYETLEQNGRMDLETLRVTLSVKKIWYTDGEINIRVPKAMEKLLPDLEYGDDPVKVRLRISF